MKAAMGTYNLLSDGIIQAARAMAMLDGVKVEEWAKWHGFERYFGSSVKREATVSWDNEKARRAFLQGIVADADRVLEMARQSQAGEPEGSIPRQGIIEAAELLGQLLLQDVERKEDGATRQAFAEADRILIAKVPGRPNKTHFPKEDFEIDLESGTCTCPAGQITRIVSIVTTRTDSSGRTHQAQGLRFHGATCGKCQLRNACVAAGKGKGRTVTLHPQEALLQQARALQHSEAFASVVSPTLR